ncbi:hypothetical protein [Streptomyces sp. YIM 121038]|uniref:hypothetical protein n=1 Tax=Streptomyces sp. YIM 121038 TaxID=2136401 RepID=UPI00111071E7|nr:hypothetical protein [Streptomyces sp. YIM 121038]
MGTSDHDLFELLDQGKDLITDALDLSAEGPESDVIELAMNAVRVLLRNPEATFAQVVEEHYPDATPDEIRGWWTRWGK